MTETVKKESDMSQIVKGRIEQIRQGIVPEGFKKTDIGIIPESWIVRSLGEISKVYGGEMIARSKLGDEGYPYLHYGDLHSVKRSFIDIEVNKSELPKLKKSLNAVKSGCLLEHGDVVFCDASEDYEGIGKHVLIKNTNNIPFIAGLHTMIAKFNDNTLVDSYKKFIFSNHNVRKEFMFYATGISVLGITLENIKKVLLPIPTENEQQKIADILSTWDRAIELKESLIKEKEEHKKGLMEKVLKPKSHWMEKNIGSVVERTKGKPVEVSNNGKYKVLGIQYLNADAEPEYTNDKSVFARKEDILLLWDGANAGNIYTDYEGVVGSTFMRLRPKDVNSIFIREYMRKDAAYIKSIREGSGIPHIPRDFLSYYKIFIPPRDEQESIAKLLSSTDKQISLLKQEVELLKEQKKGLMQLLLTGIVRVGEVEELE